MKIEIIVALISGGAVVLAAIISKIIRRSNEKNLHITIEIYDLQDKLKDKKKGIQVNIKEISPSQKRHKNNILIKKNE